MWTQESIAVLASVDAGVDAVLASVDAGVDGVSSVEAVIVRTVIVKKSSFS